MDDHVGTEPAVFGAGRDLLVEVAVRHHPGHLDHPAQLHFAPATSRLRRTQRGHEIACLLLQQFVAEVQLRHLLAQPLVRTLALHLDLLQSPLVAGQRLAQRAQQLGDRLLTLGEVPLCRRLRLAELRLGQCEELLVVLLQRLGGQFGKGAHHLPAVFVCPGPKLLGRPLDQFQLGGRDRTRRLGRRGRHRGLVQLRRQLSGCRLGVAEACLGRAGLRLQGGVA